MRKLIRQAIATSASILLLLAVAVAQDTPREDDLYVRLKATLPGVGPATVALRAHSLKRDGDSIYGQLVVLDASGRVRWEGPRSQNDANPLVFGRFPWGVSDLEVVGDIDGDRHVEVVAPNPQSDVRAPTFRILRWDGRRFRYIHASNLVESPSRSGRYVWGKGNVASGCWIAHFLAVPRSGQCRVKVVRYGDAGYEEGVALVAADARGFHRLSWVQSPRKM